MQKPFGILTLLSCDTIAECTEGLSDKAYKELWNALNDAPPLSEQITIEDSCPNDALGLNTPAKYWHKFSDEVKTELLEIAAKED